MNANDELLYSLSEQVDGELSPTQLAALRRELSMDPTLGETLRDMQRIDELLRREPDWSKIDVEAMSQNIMAGVRAEADLAEQSQGDLEDARTLRIAARQQREQQQPLSLRITTWLGGGLVAAAALALGLTLLPTLFAPEIASTPLVTPIEVEMPGLAKNEAVPSNSIEISGPGDFNRTSGSIRVESLPLLATASKSDVKGVEGPGGDVAVVTQLVNQPATTNITSASTDESMTIQE